MHLPTGRSGVITVSCASSRGPSNVPFGHRFCADVSQSAAEIVPHFSIAGGNKLLTAERERPR
jgi:hypothetical protein